MRAGRASGLTNSRILRAEACEPGDIMLSYPLVILAPMKRTRTFLSNFNDRVCAFTGGSSFFSTFFSCAAVAEGEKISPWEFHQSVSPWPAFVFVFAAVGVAAVPALVWA